MSMIGSEPQKGTEHLKVTFAVLADDVDGDVAVVGDFNDWDPTADPLWRHDGWLSATLVLKPGRRYRFRYLAEDGRWFNDSDVGVYEPNGMGDEDSVLDLTRTGGMWGDPDDRLDLHNASIDTRMAIAHLCGAFELQTGSSCIKPVHHHGSCRFAPGHAALEATAAST